MNPDPPTPASGQRPAAGGVATAEGAATKGEPAQPAGAAVHAAARPVPGSQPRKRFRWHVDWELIACGLHSHELVGTDAAEIRPGVDDWIARQIDDERLHRCLRCDVWVPIAAPARPKRQYPPSAEEITLPLKGRRLRDRYVLRLIVLDRTIRALLMGALAAGIFLFAIDRHLLRKDYTKIVQAWAAAFGGPASGQHSGIFGDIDTLFKLSTLELYTAGALVGIYAVMLAAEAIGLWGARRWAEYLTFVETSCFVPFELYALAGGVSVLKIVALAFNLAIILYLLVVHRLFGIRGGRRKAVAEYGAEG